MARYNENNIVWYICYWFQPLDARVEGKSVVNQFIFDIFLQILSFVVQNEREKIRKCKTDGIRIEKKSTYGMF